MFQRLFQRISNCFFACFIFIASALVALLTSPGDVQAQIQWSEHPGNPVMDFGPPDSWDAGTVFLPSVIKDGDTLKMWYAGSPQSPIFSELQIGYAWSLDGVNWTRYSGNPVLSKRPGEWDNGPIADAVVLQDGDTLHIWYRGLADTLPPFGPGGGAIGYATSVDGINWNRQSAPVLQRGPAGEWDANLLLPDAVIKEGNTFKMWFSGGTGEFPFTSSISIGYATSTDGIHWTKYDNPATTASPFQFSDPVLPHGGPGAFDEPIARDPHVLKTASGYEMWYVGGAARGGQIGYATSTDGIHWTKYAGNPVLRATGTWANAIITPRVILDGEQYRMWFSGFQPNVPLAGRIGYATAKREDFSNVFFTSLSEGLNMISLPLKPQTPFTARSFAKEIGATVVIKLDEVRQRFVGFTLDAPDDGFPIEGGAGYIVNLRQARQAAFTGAAWTNNPPVEAAPPFAVGSPDRAWAFVVSGEIAAEAKDGYLVTIRNTRTNAVATDVVRSGYFAAAFADLSRQSVVEIGDRLEVTVMDKTGEIASEPIQITVTPETLRQAFVPITLTNVGKPNRTVLMQNYPNPFNPETWIPFQLQDSAQVTIQIYDAKGSLVRTLNLGQQSAGFYRNRANAAYWDGRNDAGEKVASGIYFYQLRAGDFSDTRRMLILK